jgi:hypothetical protein
MSIKKLEPVLTIRKVERVGGRMGFVTTIKVYVNDTLVAEKSLGGVWTYEQCQREWKLNRRTFRVIEEHKGLLALVK